MHPLTGRERRRQKSWQIVRKHYFDRGWQHAYKLYEQAVAEALSPRAAVLDIGCGRNFPMAEILMGRCAEIHGIDPVADARESGVCIQGTGGGAAVTLKRGLADRIPYPDGMFDLAISRCVLEHLLHPETALCEIRRVLKPGGRLVFLTANKYDYVSLGAMIIPNALHGRILLAAEGRQEQDTFPTFYRANTRRRLHKLAKGCGFVIERLDLHNNYPATFMFSPTLCRLAIVYDKVVRAVGPLQWLQSWLLGELRSTKQGHAAATGAAVS